MVEHAYAMLLADLPIDLGRIDFLISAARNLADGGVEAYIIDCHSTGITPCVHVAIAKCQHSPIVGCLRIADVLARCERTGVDVIDGRGRSACECASGGVAGFAG